MTDPGDCIDCGAGGRGWNDGRCRDCDIEYALEQVACPDCGFQAWNEMGRAFFGVRESAHDSSAACPWVAL